MRAYERFLNYVPVWTTSDETSDTVPSADRELVLARMLVEEMKGLGIAMQEWTTRDMYMDTSLQLLDAKTSRRLVWLRIWTLWQMHQGKI